MSTVDRRTAIKQLLAFAGGFGISASLNEATAAEELGDTAAHQSGFQVGDKVNNFYVRAITGPLQGKSVCYVCRNGDRPVAMVLVRRIIPNLDLLLKKLDQLVDSHRADGLRGFGVFIARDTRKLLSQVQTLAFEGKISIPMTIAAAPADGPGLRAVADETALSVILYRDHIVQATFAFGEEDLAEEGIDKVLSATRRLANGDAAIGS